MHDFTRKLQITEHLLCFHQDMGWTWVWHIPEYTKILSQFICFIKLLLSKYTHFPEKVKELICAVSSSGWPVWRAKNTVKKNTLPDVTGEKDGRTDMCWAFIRLTCLAWQEYFSKDHFTHFRRKMQKLSLSGWPSAVTRPLNVWPLLLNPSDSDHCWTVFSTHEYSVHQNTTH